MASSSSSAPSFDLSLFEARKASSMNQLKAAANKSGGIVNAFLLGHVPLARKEGESERKYVPFRVIVGLVPAKGSGSPEVQFYDNSIILPVIGKTKVDGKPTKIPYPGEPVKINGLSMISVTCFSPPPVDVKPPCFVRMTGVRAEASPNPDGGWYSPSITVGGFSSWPDAPHIYDVVRLLELQYPPGPTRFIPHDELSTGYHTYLALINSDQTLYEGEGGVKATTFPATVGNMRLLRKREGELARKKTTSLQEPQTTMVKMQIQTMVGLMSEAGSQSMSMGMDFFATPLHLALGVVEKWTVEGLNEALKHLRMAAISYVDRGTLASIRPEYADHTLVPLNPSCIFVNPFDLLLAAVPVTLQFAQQQFYRHCTEVHGLTFDADSVVETSKAISEFSDIAGNDDYPHMAIGTANKLLTTSGMLENVFETCILGGVRDAPRQPIIRFAVTNMKRVVECAAWKQARELFATLREMIHEPYSEERERVCVELESLAPQFSDELLRGWQGAQDAPYAQPTEQHERPMIVVYAMKRKAEAYKRYELPPEALWKPPQSVSVEQPPLDVGIEEEADDLLSQIPLEEPGINDEPESSQKRAVPEHATSSSSRPKKKGRK